MLAEMRAELEHKIPWRRQDVTMKKQWQRQYKRAKLTAGQDVASPSILHRMCVSGQVNRDVTRNDNELDCRRGHRGALRTKTAALEIEENTTAMTSEETASSVSAETGDAKRTDEATRGEK